MTKAELNEMADDLKRLSDSMLAGKHRRAVTRAITFIRRAASHEAGVRETHTEICMNEKCPRGGMPVEVVRAALSPQEPKRS